MKNQVIQGDCLEVMRGMPDNYFDAIVTDPPAGIAFMGKDWDKHKGGMIDWVNWFSEAMAEAMRVMKPGAIGLVWSIPRTSHWTGMALELAGFRIIDVVHHCQGSGFPKGQDIGKLIDQMAGAEREVLGKRIRLGDKKPYPVNQKALNGFGKAREFHEPITAPATPEAQQWDGWKTPALKPAVEGWWLVQKPISESSIARNILTHGTGGLNIEAGRVGMKTGDKKGEGGEKKVHGGRKHTAFFGNNVGAPEDNSIGRYPSNLILSCSAECDGDRHAPDCPVQVIGGQSGVSVSKANVKSDNRKQLDTYAMNGGVGERNPFNSHTDTGTAARYFKQLPFDADTVASVWYETKASPKDRSCGGKVQNVHPTVKSRHLMAYFCKLITPPGGVILDPFGGNGTTALGAIMEGFDYVLIEQDAEYIDIIKQRIATLAPEPKQPTLEERVAWLETKVQAQGNKIKKIESGQLSLWDVANNE